MNRADVKLIIDRCVAYDVPDAADLIEELSGRFAKDQDRIKCQAEQLAAQAAQIVLLREAIKFWMQVEGDYDMIKAGGKFQLALAATADDTLEQVVERVKE